MQVGRGGIESLEHVDAGNRTASHAQNKSPMRMQFKSAATTLVLCLVFQAQAETLLGKVIHVQDGDSITVLDDTRTQHKIRLTGIDGVVSENGQQSTVSKPALPLSCSHIATTIEPLKPSREMTMSTADTYVRARIDTSTKERAADALEAMGLSISDAIRLLMLRIADERRMPFDVKAPNATTRKAIAELEAGKGKRFASVDDLMADLHADD